jgi:hypothetical protein
LKVGANQRAYYPANSKLAVAWTLELIRNNIIANLLKKLKQSTTTGNL